MAARAVRDEAAPRGRWAWLRTLGFYATGSLALLQMLDVLIDRVGLPDRMFLGVAVGVVLLLPAAVAASLLRGFVEEELLPGRPPARPVPPPAPPPPFPHAAAEPDVALVHYRLAQLCEKSGDDAGARHHYLRFLELRGGQAGSNPGP